MATSRGWNPKVYRLVFTNLIEQQQREIWLLMAAQALVAILPTPPPLIPTQTQCRGKCLSPSLSLEEI